MTSVKYKSTRGGECSMTFEEVVLKGLAKDSGLFIPETIPTFTAAQIEQMRHMSFPDLAFEVISTFIKNDEIPSVDLRDLLNRSFSAFKTTEVTPCVRLPDYWVLELFHGPTFAFKDVALQFLGNLFEYFLERGRHQTSITILGATSGDTGSAAIHGLRGKKNVNCFIMFPYGKVTEIQERQMTTVLDDNIQCLCVRGDFDDAQSIVKAAFNDAQFRDEVKLGAINSINWARILAQITHFFYAWFRITDGHKKKDSKINFAVPTGNFGDILAGYYAKRMGLPVDKLVVSTNQNDGLHKFFETGTYKKTSTIMTIAPSMDVTVSSNFERYLFYLSGENHVLLKSWMEQFETTGELTLSPGFLTLAREDFRSSSTTKQEIIDAIKSTYINQQYLICPHTATAVVAVKKLDLKNTHTMVLSTAHHAKFEEALALALPLERIPPRPIVLEELFTMPTRKTLLPTILSEVESFIRSKLQKKKFGDSSSNKVTLPPKPPVDSSSGSGYRWGWIAGFAAVSVYIIVRNWKAK